MEGGGGCLHDGEFQSQWCFMLKWSLVWYRLELEIPALDEQLVFYSLVDLVIKTSATLCNINDFGRNQRMNLRDAVAWSQPTLIMCLIPSAKQVFPQRFHVEPCAQIKAFPFSIHSIFSGCTFVWLSSSLKASIHERASLPWSALVMWLPVTVSRWQNALSHKSRSITGVWRAAQCGWRGRLSFKDITGPCLSRSI